MTFPSPAVAATPPGLLTAPDPPPNEKPVTGAAGEDDPLARDVFALSQKPRAKGDKLFIYTESLEPLLFVDWSPVAQLSAPTGVYTDDKRERKLLTLYQSSPALPGVPLTYLILDADDERLATVKRYHSPFGGTQIRVFDARAPAAAAAAPEKPARPPLLASAFEEGKWKKFLRGLPYVEAVGAGALLRTNFIIANGENRPLGYFVRGFTVVDKFLLDLRPDRARTLDRRVAVALALILETA